MTGAAAQPEQQARVVYTFGVSVRYKRRKAIYLGLATGRYWATGWEHCRWHTDFRLPFLQVGIVRALPDRPRIRVTFMGWRGVNESPRPAFREWSAGSAAGEPT
jgi:hypothetical protein